MPRVCILTDATAQFTRNDFPGRECVFTAPFRLEPTAPRRADSLPVNLPDQHLVPPSEQDFRHLYQELSRQYDSILVMALSAQLSPVAAHALSASTLYRNGASVEVLDTRTTSVGLGWLVEQAAAGAHAGETVGTIVKRIREAIKHIYFLLFIPDLGVLVETGYLSPSQVVVAGILGILPIFILEDGRLVPLNKAHSQRAVLEYFQEFLDEFEMPAQVALVHGTDQGAARINSLRQYIQASHPEANYSEHAFSPQLEALLGKQSIGMAIRQKG